MTQINYTTLQRCIDTVVGRIGLPRTLGLLNSFIGNSRLKSTESEKLRLISTYIIAQAIMIFDLDEKEFYTSKVAEYREARMACFHLIKKYTETSYSRIAERFGLKKRQVLYYCHKCDEISSIAQFYKPFMERYKSLESNTIRFIANFQTSRLMNEIENEVKKVLEAPDGSQGPEEIADESSSPLNQPVKEKAGTTEAPRAEPKETDVNYQSEKLPPDAPEQVIDENYKAGEEASGDAFELPNAHAGQAADALLGMTNNLIEVGCGWMVRIKKHEDFYDFEEVIQVIEEQNAKNVRRIKFDAEDLALLRPLLIQVLKNRSKKLTPEQQLLGVLLSIMVKKAPVVMEIKVENERLAARILEMIRMEGRDEDEGLKEKPEAEPPGSDFEETVLEVAEEEES